MYTSEPVSTSASPLSLDFPTSNNFLSVVLSLFGASVELFPLLPVLLASMLLFCYCEAANAIRIGSSFSLLSFLESINLSASKTSSSSDPL